MLYNSSEICKYLSISTASLPEDLNLRQRRCESLKFRFKLGLDFEKSTFIDFTLMLPGNKIIMFNLHDKEGFVSPCFYMKMETDLDQNVLDIISDTQNRQYARKVLLYLRYAHRRRISLHHTGFERLHILTFNSIACYSVFSIACCVKLIFKIRLNIDNITEMCHLKMIFSFFGIVNPKF
jgi:hypothetical protein